MFQDTKKNSVQRNNFLIILEDEIFHIIFSEFREKNLYIFFAKTNKCTFTLEYIFQRNFDYVTQSLFLCVQLQPFSRIPQYLN